MVEPKLITSKLIPYCAIRKNNLISNGQKLAKQIRRLTSSRGVAISENAEACKFSTTTIWLASQKQLYNPNQDLIASPTPIGWAKTDSFAAASILVQLKITLN